ncbi:hypothetical protein ACFLYR_08950 [Chloroflexota bacterium]
MDFDWGEIGKVLSYLIPVIMFLLFNVFFKKQREQQRRMAVVKSLLSETDFNSKLVDSFSFQSQMKNFKTATWKKNKDKMDYVDQTLYSILAGAYEIAEGFNREIDVARKYGSTSYIAGIDTRRLVEPLAKSRRGLEEWIELNKGKKKVTDT